MADITITVSDGTVTANLITIPDARVAVTAAALSAAVGDAAPPANSARAVRQALAVWISATRKNHRVNMARVSANATFEAAAAAVLADEPAP